MINVIYHRDLNRVSVTGHAQSGEAGHDLVCASASILVYTLASFVTNMKEARQSYNPKIELKEGDALIYFYQLPHKRYYRDNPLRAAQSLPLWNQIQG